MVQFTLKGAHSPVSPGVEDEDEESDDGVLFSDEEDSKEDSPGRGIIRPMGHMPAPSTGVHEVDFVPDVPCRENGYQNTPDGITVAEYVAIPRERLPPLPDWLAPNALQGNIKLPRDGDSEQKEVYVHHGRHWTEQGFEHAQWDTAMRYLLVAPRDKIGWWEGQDLVTFMANEGNFVIKTRDKQQREHMIRCLQLAVDRMANSCLLYTSPSPRDS